MDKETKLKMCRFYGKATSIPKSQIEEIEKLEYFWVNDNSDEEHVRDMIENYHKYYKKVVNANLNICEELAAYLCMRYGKYSDAQGVLEKLEMYYMDFG